MPFADYDLEHWRQEFTAEIQKVRNSFWYVHHQKQSRVRLLETDPYAIPGRRRRFDVGLLASVLLHCRRPFDLLESVARRTERTMIITEIWNPTPRRGAGVHAAAASGHETGAHLVAFHPQFFISALGILGFTERASACTPSVNLPKTAKSPCSPWCANAPSRRPLRPTVRAEHARNHPDRHLADPGPATAGAGRRRTGAQPGPARLRLRPPGSHLALGEILLHSGQYDAAHAPAVARRPAMATCGRPAPLPGLLEQQLGQREAAIDSLRWACTLDPSQHDAAFRLAWALHDQGELDEALYWACHALAGERNNPRLLQTGWLLQQTGQLAAAAEHYQHAIAAYPAHAAEQDQLHCNWPNASCCWHIPPPHTPPWTPGCAVFLMTPAC